MHLLRSAPSEKQRPPAVLPQHLQQVDEGLGDAAPA